MPKSEVRIDKWLWAVRVFKTRTVASEACKKGRVMIGDAVAKPARTVKVGDVVKVRKPPVTYLDRRQVDSGLLHLLFGALEKLCGELTAYFLVEQHVLLNPAYVYLDVTQNSLGFVYLPGYQEDIRDAFQTLMEQLLRRLNHGDKQASAMAYEMYQHSLKREESFSDMLLKALDAGHAGQRPRA